MRVLVCGGRNFDNYVAIYHALDDIQEERGPFTEVITGGASGADTWAESWAWMAKIPHRAFKADWRAHGRAAGPIRNQQMVEALPDLVVAFPGGRGTADMTRRATAANIPVIKVLPA